MRIRLVLLVFLTLLGWAPRAMVGGEIVVNAGNRIEEGKALCQEVLVGGGWTGGGIVGTYYAGTNFTGTSSQRTDVRIDFPKTNVAPGGALPIAMLQTGGPYGYGMEWAILDGVWDTPPYAPAPPKLQAYLNVQNAVPATLDGG